MIAGVSDTGRAEAPSNRPEFSAYSLQVHATDFQRPGHSMTSEIADDLPDVHLEDVKQELEPLTGMSVWARMRLSYHDMRRTTRALIDEQPSEPRLLFFVLLSDVLFFLSRGVALVVSPSETVEQSLPVPAQLGLILILALLLRTLTLYVFAALVCIGGRAFGGRASYKDTRTGVFWASLVAAPVGILGALIGAAFAHLESTSAIFASTLFSWPPLLIGPVAFVFFLSAGVAEAHRFSRTSPVFIVFSVLTVVALLAAVAFGPMLLERIGLSV